jgi:hypothetical protein
MIDKQRIQQAAKDYSAGSENAISNERSFFDGAFWVLSDMNEAHNAAADLIEKLRSENAKQLEMIRVQSECLCNIIKVMQENGK